MRAKIIADVAVASVIIALLAWWMKTAPFLETASNLPLGQSVSIFATVMGMEFLGLIIAYKIIKWIHKGK